MDVREQDEGDDVVNESGTHDDAADSGGHDVECV